MFSLSIWLSLIWLQYLWTAPLLLGISSEDRRGRGAARRRGSGGGEIEFWKLNCKQRNVDVKTLQLHLFEENKSLNQNICTEGFLVSAVYLEMVPVKSFIFQYWGWFPFPYSKNMGRNFLGNKCEITASHSAVGTDPQLCCAMVNMFMTMIDV